MSWGVWAHHMFSTGLGPVAISAFGLSTMLIAIPTGVKIFNWLGTVYGGAVKLTDRDAVLPRLRGDVHARRPLRRVALDRAGRHAADRHLLRRRALPLRALRRARVRDLRRLLLLVAQDLRPHDERTHRQVELLDDAHRVQPHVLPDAHPRARRHAAAHLPLSERHGLGHDEPARDDRRVRHRRRRCSCCSST